MKGALFLPTTGTTGRVARKGNKWYCVLNLYNEEGERKQKWLATGLDVKGNKRNAEKRLKELCVEYDSKNLNYYSILLFSDYLKKWLTKIEKEVRPNTFRTYKGNMENHIIPYFEKQKVTLQDLKPFQINEFYKSKIGVVSNTTIKHFQQNISKALSDAIISGLITINPATAVKTPKTTTNFKAKYLNEEQIFELAQTVKERQSNIYLPVFLCGVYGFRRSEVLGLKWSNIDFTGIGKIHICETLQQTTKSISGVANYTSNTKTESSNRTLPMTQHAKEVLLYYKAKQRENKELLEDSYIDNDYVCTFDNGAVITPNYLSRVFHKVIIETDLPHIRLHDLRHSVASILLNRGFTTVQVAEWLGHSSSTTTLKYYAHSDKTSKMAIANSIDYI